MVSHHPSTSALAQKNKGNRSLSQEKHAATTLIRKTSRLQKLPLSPRLLPDRSDPAGSSESLEGRGVGAGGLVCVCGDPPRTLPIRALCRRSARQNAGSRSLSRRSAAPAPPRPALQRPPAARDRGGGRRGVTDASACAGRERVPNDGAGWQGGGACAAGRGGFAPARQSRGGRCEEKRGCRSVCCYGVGRRGGEGGGGAGSCEYGGLWWGSGRPPLGATWQGGGSSSEQPLTLPPALCGGLCVTGWFTHVAPFPPRKLA